jgi:hypothetical protein
MLMQNTLTLDITPAQGAAHSIDVEVGKIGCSRNAARDIEATKAGLEKIRAKGYQMHPPAGVCFRSRYLITNEDTIEVQGAQTSGEVEFVAVRHQGQIYISVGSDHNDRSVEDMWTAMLGKVYDSAKLKQLAPSVVAREAWPYEDIKDHWDEIILRSYVTANGQKIPYQEFPLSNLLDLEYYLDHCPWLGEDGSFLLGGSSDLVDELPKDLYQGQSTMEGVVFPPDFHCQMIDPVLDRNIAHSYAILALDEPGSLSL